MPHTVLLVDDEPNVLHGLQRALRKEPYDILSANSPAEALAILRTRPVDVVISDQDMPDMVGTEFLTRVQQEFPDTVRFILTGKGALQVTQQALSRGIINKCLAKPCNRADLSDTIRQALAQRPGHAAPPPVAHPFGEQIIALERLASDQPDLTVELVETIRHLLTKRGLQAETQHFADPDTPLRANLERLAHDHPTTLAEMLMGLHQLLVHKNLHSQAQSLLPPTRSPGHASASPAVTPPVTIKEHASEDDTGHDMPNEASFADCLRQLCMTAQANREYAGIMRLQRHQQSLRVTTLGDMSFEECCRLCMKAPEVMLVRLQNGKVVRATLDSIQPTFLVVDTERSMFFSRQGEKLLVIFPAPPQDYYVWLTWIDSVYLKRLKLGFKIPQYHVHR